MVSFESCSFSQHSQGSGMMPFLMPMPIPPVRFLAGMNASSSKYSTCWCDQLQAVRWSA
jgi:hypothetical protein